MSRNPLNNNLAAQTEALKQRTDQALENFEDLLAHGVSAAHAVKQVGYKTANSLDKTYRNKKRPTPQALKDETAWEHRFRSRQP